MFDFQIADVITHCLTPYVLKMKVSGHTASRIVTRVSRVRARVRVRVS